MKSMFDRIGRLIAAYSQKPAPSYEPITPADPHQTDLVPSSEPRRSSEHIESNFDAKRKELSVEDGLKDIPGVTTQNVWWSRLSEQIFRVDKWSVCRG